MEIQRETQQPTDEKVRPPLLNGNGLECRSSESMTSQAYSRLRGDIISGELEPGQKLKISELRAQYDVGTSPIREALSLLTSDQFVERIDQRGFKVTNVSAGDFDELLKTRCWLEERALRESIANGSSAWEEQVVLAVYRLSRVPRSGPNEDYFTDIGREARHKHFHMSLISACGSSILTMYCDRLYDQAVRYRKMLHKLTIPTGVGASEHGAICDAVLARDADLASQLLVEHYIHTGTILKDQLL